MKNKRPRIKVKQPTNVKTTNRVELICSGNLDGFNSSQRKMNPGTVTRF
jgi:hypothetical protein